MSQRKMAGVGVGGQPGQEIYIILYFILFSRKEATSSPVELPCPQRAGNPMEEEEEPLGMKDTRRTRPSKSIEQSSNKLIEASCPGPAWLCIRSSTCIL